MIYLYGGNERSSLFPNKIILVVRIDGILGIIGRTDDDSYLVSFLPGVGNALLQFDSDLINSLGGHPGRFIPTGAIAHTLDARHEHNCLPGYRVEITEADGDVSIGSVALNVHLQDRGS